MPELSSHGTVSNMRCVLQRAKGYAQGHKPKPVTPPSSPADHGGGKRRVVICGFAAKPSAVGNRRLCLVPTRAALNPAQGAHAANVGCRTNTGGGLRGPTERQVYALAGTSPELVRLSRTSIADEMRE